MRRSFHSLLVIVTATYQPDHSYAWFRRDDDHKKPPIHAFEEGLVALAESGQI